MNDIKYKYFILWLKHLGLKLEICWSRFCLSLLFFLIILNRREKRIAIIINLPKYAFIFTNEKGYPYTRNDECFYWKYKWLYIGHVVGSELIKIDRS